MNAPTPCYLSSALQALAGCLVASLAYAADPLPPSPPADWESRACKRWLASNPTRAKPLQRACRELLQISPKKKLDTPKRKP